ncbi:hypothetical protein GCM10029992_46440 [Glycomyces albus]
MLDVGPLQVAYDRAAAEGRDVLDVVGIADQSGDRVAVGAMISVRCRAIWPCPPAMTMFMVCRVVASADAANRSGRTGSEPGYGAAGSGVPPRTDENHRVFC